MNGLEFLFDSSVWQQQAIRLSLTLLHFLWQGLLVGGVAAIALACCRRKSANARYLIACVAFFSLPLLAAATFWLVEIPTEVALASPSSIESGEVTLAEPLAIADSPASSLLIETSTTSDAVLPSESAPAPMLENIPKVEVVQPVIVPKPTRLTAIYRFLPLIAAAYVVGAFVLLLRLQLRIWRGSRLCSRSPAVQDPSLVDLATRLAKQAGLNCVPAIRYCDRVVVPTVVGILKPVVLVPASLISQLTPEELTSILNHELAHIRRRDPIVQVLQKTVEALLFFHPVMWWLSRRIRIERENCCDDIASRDSGQLPYAAALLRMAELCVSDDQKRSTALANLAVDGNNKTEFASRIRRLIGADDTPSFSLSRRGVYLLLTVGLLASVSFTASASNQSKSDQHRPDTPNPQLNLGSAKVRFSPIKPGSGMAPRSTLVVHPSNVNPQVMKSLLASQSVANGTNQFEYHVVTQAEFRDLNTLSQYHAVFVLDPKPISDDRWELLRAFVENGGGLGLFLGPNANSKGFIDASFTTEIAQRLIGGRLEQLRLDETEKLVLSPPNKTSHPIFKPIQGSETSILWNRFPIAKFWGFQQDDSANAPPTRTLLQFTNREPAVIERVIGKGRVLTMTTPVTEAGYNPDRKSWNVLLGGTGLKPLPLFLLLKGMVSYLTQSDAESLNVKVDEVPRSKWGDESHGLRCRILPVSPSMDPEKIELTAPVDRFASPDDITFAVEIENVSGQLITLKDVLRRDGTLDANHYAPHLFEFLFTDPSGKPIARTQREFVLASHAHILHGAPVKQIEPGQTLKYLLQPAKFQRSMDYQLPPGDYRVQVRYQGPSPAVKDWVVKVLKQQKPEPSWFHQLTSNVASFSIAANGFRQPDLVWGPETDGMQAALEIRVPRDSGIPTQAPGVLPKTSRDAVLHVKNVSNKPITFVSETGRQGDTLQIKTANGEEIEVKDTWFSGWPIDVKWTIQPSEVAQLDVLTPGLNQPLAPGEYSARYTIRFNSRTLKDKDWQPNLPGSWRLSIQYRHGVGAAVPA